MAEACCLPPYEQRALGPSPSAAVGVRAEPARPIPHSAVASPADPHDGVVISRDDGDDDDSEKI
jgi:hypothetical protein